MTPEEAAAAVTYLNQLDPRVQLNEQTTDLWWYAIESLPADQVRWVIRDYYATANPNQTSGIQPLTPATLKHRLADMRERVASKRRALDPPKPTRTIGSYRKDDPERWDSLVIQGRDQHRGGLKARGITPHAESCPECRHDNRRTEAAPNRAASPIPEGGTK